MEGSNCGFDTGTLDIRNTGTTLMETPNFGVYNIKIGCQSQLRHQKWVSIKVDKGCPDTLDGCPDTNKRYHDTIFGSDSMSVMVPSEGRHGYFEEVSGSLLTPLTPLDDSAFGRLTPC